MEIWYDYLNFNIHSFESSAMTIYFQYIHSSFLASGDVCGLLSGWIQTVWQSDSVSEIFFFEKSPQKTSKA